MSLSKVFSLSSFNRFMLISLMVISLMMPACMPTPSIMKMKPEYYPQCYQPFEDLEQAKRDLISRTLIGAGLGGLNLSGRPISLTDFLSSGAVSSVIQNQYLFVIWQQGIQA